MKERPILFSGEMVRAILDGRKTVTRRVVKPQPKGQWDKAKLIGTAWDFFNSADRFDHGYHKKGCPYGQPGDRLYVRETWSKDKSVIVGHQRIWECLYRADGERPVKVDWKPSIHMPRWASRIMLEVTGVRVERLNKMTDWDAVCEGIIADAEDNFPHNYLRQFMKLWDSINGRGAWDKNPFVWVIEFKRLQENQK